MNKKILLMKVATIFFLTQVIIPFTAKVDKVDAFTNQVIQQGAVGEDVIELQSRLQYIGYYNGKIDGVFGWKTYWALRNFQYEFGLPIDGLAGLKTRQKLVDVTKYNEQFVKKQINKGNKFTHYGGVDLAKQKGPNPKGNNAKNNNQGTTTQKKPTANTQAKKPAAQQPKQNTAANKTQNNQTAKKPAAPNGTAKNQSRPKATAVTPPKKPTAANVPSGFSQNDIQLMANAVYGEARGEPYIGQVAVAAVILNRVQSATFPNTVSGVIFEPRAFTAVADGQIWLTPNENAKKAVMDAMNGWDPTGNAIYYFNPDTATSGWIWSRPQIKRIGKHIFCK
ncbi:spore cortex-lytic enzyme [Robertmurraya korlensis]|uniref:spore cortex-lytic enzyme n=1 Tax=Robertmurraya korlensis TaxID=519977 RepID=UPI000824067A|nr:spore cortex-lytic enzyme [Robertmurraya korlensis]